MRTPQVRRTETANKPWLRIFAFLTAVAGALLVAGFFARPIQLTMRVLGRNLSLSTASPTGLVIGLVFLLAALSVVFRRYLRRR
jgi:TRAP-type C4-dicarboxylate transport system permease small subunit